MYVNYNDNELIYLYKEGEQKALNELFLKYEHCICQIVASFYPYGDKRRDLYQEGRIVLFECIKHYSSNKNISFYSYFVLSLKRKINKLTNTDYYNNTILFREEISTYSLNENSGLLSIYNKLFKDDILAKIIWDYHIVREVSIRKLAEIYDIDYFKLLRKKESILECLKKYIDYL